MSAQKAWESFLEKFYAACERVGRKTSEVQILPVSKGQSVPKIKEFLDCKNFPRTLGENYFNELQEKFGAVSGVEWHYLGALQSRKITALCEIAEVFHGISRAKELEFISRSANTTQFFLQINISDESQKLGASESEIPKLLEKISEFKLEKKFLGFMGLAAEQSERVSDQLVRTHFAKLRELRDRFCPTKKLSMGMSADYELALAEGSDLVRIGSLIFGART